MENQQRVKRVGTHDKVGKNAEVRRTIIRFFLFQEYYTISKLSYDISNMRLYLESITIVF